MLEWISTAAVNSTSMFTGMAIVSSVSVSAIVGMSKTLSALPDVPGKVRGWMKKKKMDSVATLRAVERAEMDIHDSQNQESKIKEKDELIAKLDIDFNRIKSELKYNKLNDIVAVGKWSNEFTYAIGLLGERTSAITDKMRRLDDLMAHTEKTLKDQRASLDKRNEARSKLDFSKNSILETFAQVSGFKFDLLMMARAFDHYKNAIAREKSSARLTQDQMTLLLRKETFFDELKIQFTSLAALSAKWSSQLLVELNKIDEMDAIVNTNSILSGME
jgi:hypothetical protein